MLSSEGSARRVLVALCVCVLSAAYTQESPGQTQPEDRSRVFKRSTEYRSDPRLQPPHRIQPRHEQSDGSDPEPRYLARVDRRDLPRLDQPGVLQPIAVLRGEIVKADEALKALTVVTGVTLKLQAEWAFTWVVLPQRAYSGRDLMELVGSVFGGHWHTDGECWVLAEDASIAQLTALSAGEHLQLTLPRTRRLIQSITAQQWERLAMGGTLPFTELSPWQRRILLDKIRIDRYGPGRRTRTPTPGGMRGQGVFLKLVGSGRDATLDIGVPLVPYFSVIERNQPTRSISFFRENGELAWGVPPPR